VNVARLAAPAGGGGMSCPQDVGFPCVVSSGGLRPHNVVDTTSRCFCGGGDGANSCTAEDGVLMLCQGPPQTKINPMECLLPVLGPA